MGTLLELVGYERDDSLKDRIQGACWREAKTILTEDPNGPLHTERIAWAIRVLRAGDSEAPVFAEMRRAVITVRDTGDISDPDIQATVNTAVNFFAAAGV